MYSNEEPRDQERIYRRYRGSPLDWLANMPVMQRKIRIRVRIVSGLLALAIGIYWLTPQWGISPFHTREDGLDYEPYFSDASVWTPPLADTVPVASARINLMGNWPGWTLAQYDHGRFFLLALRNADGSVRWVRQVYKKPAWVGDYHIEQEGSGWAWSGGWKVTLASPELASGAVYLSPDGDLRYLRHNPLHEPALQR